MAAEDPPLLKALGSANGGGARLSERATLEPTRRRLHQCVELCGGGARLASRTLITPVLPYLTLVTAVTVVTQTPPYALAALTPALVAISLRDLGTRTVPSWASPWVALVGLAGWPDLHALLAAAITAAAILGVLWAASSTLFHRLGREALGLGDVKLIAAITLVTGPAGIAPVVLLASLGGILFALLTRRSGGDQDIPFAPFLSYALAVTLAIDALASAARP